MERRATARPRFLVARAVYVALVLLATLSDLEFSTDLGHAGWRLVRAFALSLGWRDAIDGIRNLSLFAGLGSVWVVTSLAARERAAIGRATLAGFALSVAVEGVQCFSPVRLASIADVAMNVIGTLAGAWAIAVLIEAVRSSQVTNRSYLGIPAFLFAGAYSVAALCEWLTPLFRSGVVIRIPGGPLARLHAALELAFPLSLRAVPWSDVPLMAAAGFLACMWMAEHEHEPGWTSRGKATLLVCVASLAIVALHVAHGLFGLQIRWEAVATDVIATGAGVWAGQRWRPALSRAPRGAARARAAVLAYGFLLLLWGWRPFLPETSARAIAAQLTTSSHWIPLVSLAERADVFSASHVIQQFFLYVPLGALLSVWPLRLTGRWSHLWPALWLAVAVEFGHIVIADRTFDVTNILIAAAGLGMAWVVVRRAGVVPRE